MNPFSLAACAEKGKGINVIIDKQLAEGDGQRKVAIHGSVNTETIIVEAHNIVQFLSSSGFGTYSVHDFAAPVPNQQSVNSKPAPIAATKDGMLKLLT